MGPSTSVLLVLLSVYGFTSLFPTFSSALILWRSLLVMILFVCVGGGSPCPGNAIHAMVVCGGYKNVLWSSFIPSSCFCLGSVVSSPSHQTLTSSIFSTEPSDWSKKPFQSFFFSPVLWINLRALCAAGTHSATELHAQIYPWVPLSLFLSPLCCFPFLLGRGWFSQFHVQSWRHVSYLQWDGSGGNEILISQKQMSHKILCVNLDSEMELVHLEPLLWIPNQVCPWGKERMCFASLIGLYSSMTLHCSSISQPELYWNI